jgi:hypothetical protein
MDAKQLIENLIASIESGDLDEAKETAALAKLVLPSLDQPVAVATTPPPFQPGDRVRYPTGTNLHRTAEFVRTKDSTTAILKDQDDPGGFEVPLADIQHDSGGNPTATTAATAQDDAPHAPFANVPKGGLYRK